MKQHQNKAYAWIFTDGDKFILQSDENGVTDSDLDLLCQIDQRDANDRRRYRRHNISLESTAMSVDKSLLHMDFHVDVEDAILDQLEAQYWHTQLDESIAELSDPQVHLLKQVYTEKRSLREIARFEGVSVNAIWKRLLTILRKLQKNLR